LYEYCAEDIGTVGRKEGREGEENEKREGRKKKKKGERKKWNKRGLGKLKFQQNGKKRKVKKLHNTYLYKYIDRYKDIYIFIVQIYFFNCCSFKFF
jgi:hypothetical protein